MKLLEALENDVGLTLVCKSCGKHQPAYVHLMIEKHGPDMDLTEALKLTRCFFCNGQGDLTVIISNVE